MFLANLLFKFSLYFFGIGVIGGALGYGHDLGLRKVINEISFKAGVFFPCNEILKKSFIQNYTVISSLGIGYGSYESNEEPRRKEFSEDQWKGHEAELARKSQLGL